MGEHLTQDQYDHLAAELAELEGPRRKNLVEAIATAREEGDLSENAEYHAAKNEQGLLERKITILRARIEDGDGGRMEVEISGLGGSGMSSPSSPLGTALLGKRVGETVDVQAPKSTWQATVV